MEGDDAAKRWSEAREANGVFYVPMPLWHTHSYSLWRPRVAVRSDVQLNIQLRSYDELIVKGSDKDKPQRPEQA